MSYSTLKFLGLSVNSVSQSIGWGVQQQSSLQVTLVEDTVGGDVFTSPSLGTPITFNAGSSSFRGIIQKYIKRKSIQGELYDVLVVDPRIVLENAQVIIGGYGGTTGGIDNLYNVFGYWETLLGFGGSAANDAGMPWYKIRLALLNMINSGANGGYGGPLVFRGYSYRLDLSEVPNPSNDYRIAGGQIGLLELIAQICDDGGHDFYVTLVGDVITFKTVSRIGAPPLGTITNLIESAEGNNLTRSEVGLELRNENNSTFLVGGEVTTLHMTSGIASFWGFDQAGNPILGTPGAVVITDGSGDIVSIERADFMLLNASPVADVVGSTNYDCSTFEMRLALADQHSWRAYVQAYKPAFAQSINLAGTIRVNHLTGVVPGISTMPVDITDTTAQNVNNFILVEEENNVARLYDFVRSYAQNFMGKKYAVAIPYLTRKIDSETLLTTYSHEPVDGGYMPEGSEPLGLDEINEDVFKIPDGRFAPFVMFDYLGSGFDMSRVSPDDVVMQQVDEVGGIPIFDMYMKAGVESQIIFTPDPAVVIDLPSPVYELANDDTLYGRMSELETAFNRVNDNAAVQAAAVAAEGLLDLVGLIPGVGGVIQSGVNIVVGTTRNSLQPLQYGFGSVPHAIESPIIPPTFAAVPLKSNILTYGPWTALGVDGGKVRYEQDSTLVPWNYGGHNGMNLAALSKIANSATNMQVSEVGSVEQEGLPVANIGDTLELNGPNITDINIRYDAQGGAVTTYSFKTYSPRFGVFNKNQAEKIRRIGTISHQLRREIRSKVNETNVKVGVQREAYEGRSRSLVRAFSLNTPHPVMVSQAVMSDNKLRVGTSALTLDEAMVGVAPSSTYKNSAVVSMSSLFRPISTAPLSGSYIPSLTTPSGGFTGLTVNDYNPYYDADGKQLHTDILTVGDTYQDLNVVDGTTISSAQPGRFVGLAGPVMITSWGPTVDGGVTPTGSSRTAYPTDFRSCSDRWASGPLELHFDNYRGVWTMPRMLKGTLRNTLAANGSEVLIVASGSTASTAFRVTVKNYFNTAVSSGTRVIANYDPMDNAWFVVAANC